MADYGWILLNRGITENWIYKEKSFDKCHAWIDLLIIAEYSTKNKIWRGSLTEFKRGDVCVSIEKLAERWGWSRKKTRHFLEQLEKDQMVHLKVTPQRTVISIVNYNKFQGQGTPNGTPKRTSNGTPKDTAKDTADVTPKDTAKDTHLKESIKKDKESKESVPQYSDDPERNAEIIRELARGAILREDGSLDYSNVKSSWE